MAKKKYKFRASVMIITASAVAQNMLDNLPAFAKDYPDWTEERIGGFFADIEKAGARTGVRSTRDLQEATVHLRKISESAVGDCLTVKNQIERGFRKEPERQQELLQLLGFTRYWPKAHEGNQMALLDLAAAFSNNSNEAVTAELTAHGVVAHRIESIKNSTATLKLANITQESLKSETPVITEDTNIQLNEIYDTAIDICTAGKTVFRKDAVRRALFSFNRIASQLATPSKSKHGENNMQAETPVNG